MKVRKLVKTIFALSMFLFLVVKLPAATALADDLTSVTLNVNYVSIVKGKAFALNAYNLKENQTISYRSSAPAIATVSEGGRIVGVTLGSAIITATVYEEGEAVQTLTCSVYVGPAAAAIMLMQMEMTIEVGEKEKIDYFLFPLTTAESPKFSFEDSYFASVTSKGTVKGKHEGSTNLYVTLESGVIATCKVNVVAAVEKTSEGDNKTSSSGEVME